MRNLRPQSPLPYLHAAPDLDGPTSLHAPFALHRPAAAALLAATLALGACKGATTPIVIGLAGPFSEERGRAMLLAARLAVDEINAAGGVRGRQLALAVEDDSASNARAIAVALKLRENPDVVAVIGHLTSGTTIAAADIYNAGERPVLEISPSASNPDLTGIGRYTFRVCATDLLHGSALARYAYHRLGVRRAAIVYLNDDYGRGILGTFAEEFQNLGGTVVSRDPVLPTTTDLDPYLERLQRDGSAQLLMVAGDRTTAGKVLRQARARGITLPLMGGDGLTGIQSEGAIADGVYLTSNWLPEGGGERNAAFLAAYATAYGGQRPDHRGAGAYDAVYLIVDAVRTAGMDRARVRNALAEVGRGREAYQGVTGRVAFDDRGDVVDKTVLVGVVRNGAIVLADGQ